MSLLQMSFSGAVLILAIIIVRAVAINKLPKKTFLFLWAITIARLLIPFSIPSPASVYSLVYVNSSEETLLGNMIPIMPVEQKESINEVEQMESKAEVQQIQEQQPAKQIHYVSAWQVAWCIGVVVCISFFTIFYLHWLSRFRIARLVHNSTVEQWIKEHKLKRTISIRQSDKIDTPLTYGIFHPVILMPKDTNWEDIQQIKYILQHEYIHICRFDSVTKLICALAVCIHWFNPLVWVMYLLFNRDLELSCDERVVRKFGVQTRKKYANILISMEAKKSGLMPFYNNFSKNAIEERITSIMKIKKTSFFTILIAIVLIIGITTACATSATKSEANDSTENELDSEGLPSETDTAGLQDTEHTSDEQSSNAASKQDDNMFSGMEERYKAILLGDEDFVNIDHSDQDISLNIENIKEVVSDEDWVTAKVIKFTIIDLDGNGENEIALWIQVNEREDYYFEILYFHDQEVYGFSLPYRAFMHLKTDGTFYSSGGMDNRGIRRLRLSERGYTIEEVADSESQEEKTDVEWYDLTPDNVVLAFDNNF